MKAGGNFFMGSHGCNLFSKVKCSRKIGGSIFQTENTAANLGHHGSNKN
jgi:hypothetical protein